MSTKLTKVELEQINARLSAELCELRAKLSVLRTEKHELLVKVGIRDTEIDALRADLAANWGLSSTILELRTEKDALSARIDELNGEKIELMAKRKDQIYPLVDRLGRHYRMENIHGRTIKCFAPGAQHG